MWAFMKANRSFTYAALESASTANRWQLDNFTSRLRRMGLIRLHKREGTVNYFTVYDTKASAKLAAEKRGTREGAIWTVMRTMKDFTPQELLLAIEGADHRITKRFIERYCQVLVKAKYLAVQQKAVPGKRAARYRLANDTGPLPPVQRQLVVLFDNNLEQAVWHPTVRL